MTSDNIVKYVYTVVDPLYARSWSIYAWNLRLYCDEKKIIKPIMDN